MADKRVGEKENEGDVDAVSHLSAPHDLSDFSEDTRYYRNC